MLRGWRRRFRYWRQGRPWVRCAACGLPVPVDIAEPMRSTGSQQPNFGRTDAYGSARSLGGRFLYDRQSPDEGFVYDSSPGEEVNPPLRNRPADLFLDQSTLPGVRDVVPVWRMRSRDPLHHARRWVCSLACKEELDAEGVMAAGTPGQNVWGGERWKRGL